MRKLFVALVWSVLMIVGCGSDPKAAASCASNDDCPSDQACLTSFKGGYCGLMGCMVAADCPDGTLCVTHEGANYCFLACADKAECNEERGADEEANCSSNIDLAEGGKTKACVPPSG